MAHAREILDRDHYDLEKVKDRILEFLAVRKLKADLHGPILCFVGPPGVGKTSLGQSIAEAMGRKFVRISVGGVRDEAEIRGHRRTYVGAMPGIIVRAMRDAGTNNPVFMIDEIDKIGADWRGDPSSALLEVLDPEQNITFRDHYLDLPFDLSRVLFISTANLLEPDPGAAARPHGDHRPRRLHRSRRSSTSPSSYLVPRQAEANGLKTGQVTFTRRGARRDHHELHARGRRAQPRARDRHHLPQARARGRRGRTAAASASPSTSSACTSCSAGRAPTARSSGARSDARRGHRPGLDAGGRRHPLHRGDAMPGNGNLTLTGQLGDVMKESAQAALTYVRTHSPELGLDDDYFQKHDIHIHVPAGAIPKDGPSAGVTMATAIASLVTGTPVSTTWP